MKCKFCSAELEDGADFCPKCGIVQDIDIPDEGAESAMPVEEAGEDQPARGKKRNKKRIIALTVGIALAAVGLLVLVLHFTGNLDNFARWLGFNIKTDVFEKASYTADNIEVRAASDVVVATLGKQKLTNGELQFYYWNTVNNYGVSDKNFNPAKPFDEQIYDQATGMTYQQYFLEKAIAVWRDDVAVFAQLADDAGFQLAPAQQEALDDLPSDMRAMANQYGYTNIDEFLEAMFAPGFTPISCISYYNTVWKSEFYLDQLYNNALKPSAAELEAYYAAHETELVQNKHSKADGDYYDVRRILIPVKGEGVADETGKLTYTQQQWDECLAEAQKLLAEFLANNPTEATFAELAKKNSKDPGSANNGGLYEDLIKGYGFNPNFEDWYTDAGRQAGDTGIVQNTAELPQGYHIIYFCGKSPVWEQEAGLGVLMEKREALLAEGKSKYTLKVRYDKILLGQLTAAAG